MTEPLQIEVGEYTVKITETGIVYLSSSGPRDQWQNLQPLVIASLARELAEARKDVARLDWLERNPHDLCHYNGVWAVMTRRCVTSEHLTPRTAIDNAMAPHPPGTGA